MLFGDAKDETNLSLELIPSSFELPLESSEHQLDFNERILRAQEFQAFLLGLTLQKIKKISLQTLENQENLETIRGENQQLRDQIKKLKDLSINTKNQIKTFQDGLKKTLNWVKILKFHAVKKTKVKDWIGEYLKVGFTIFAKEAPTLLVTGLIYRVLYLDSLLSFITALIKTTSRSDRIASQSRILGKLAAIAVIYWIVRRRLMNAGFLVEERRRMRLIFYRLPHSRLVKLKYPIKPINKLPLLIQNNYTNAAQIEEKRNQMKKRNSIRRLVNIDRESDLVVSESLKLPQRIRKSLPIVACCTAEAYNFQSLLPFLQKHFILSPFICDKVLHITIKNSDILPFNGDAFFFKAGAFVFWSEATEDDGWNSNLVIERMGSILRSFEIVSNENQFEMEEMSYRPSTSNFSGISDEILYLRTLKEQNQGVSVKEKLAFSNGLADSVKLAVLESLLDDYIDQVKHIPTILQQGRKVPLSRAQVLRLTGKLLHFRAQLNLHSDLIDTPDLYWSEPQLEELYRKISQVLETRGRIGILNKKVDYAKEMAQVLSDHLNEQHSLKLEWGIIALIAVEVAFETFHLAARTL